MSAAATTAGPTNPSPLLASQVRLQRLGQLVNRIIWGMAGPAVGATTPSTFDKHWAERVSWAKALLLVLAPLFRKTGLVLVKSFSLPTGGTMAIGFAESVARDWCLRHYGQQSAICARTDDPSWISAVPPQRRNLSQQRCGKLISLDTTGRTARRHRRDRRWCGVCSNTSLSSGCHRWKVSFAASLESWAIIQVDCNVDTSPLIQAIAQNPLMNVVCSQPPALACSASHGNFRSTFQQAVHKAKAATGKDCQLVVCLISDSQFRNQNRNVYIARVATELGTPTYCLNANAFLPKDVECERVSDEPNLGHDFYRRIYQETFGQQNKDRIFLVGVCKPERATAAKLGEHDYWYNYRQTESWSYYSSDGHKYRVPSDALRKQLALPVGRSTDEDYGPQWSSGNEITVQLVFGDDGRGRLSFWLDGRALGEAVDDVVGPVHPYVAAFYTNSGFHFCWVRNRIVKEKIDRSTS